MEDNKTVSSHIKKYIFMRNARKSVFNYTGLQKIFC